jgi:class 3 adenylate cyclase/tetratricopeptide (TPR) repeat protein
MLCPHCRRENRKTRRFCAECGLPLDWMCLSCQFVNTQGENFCGGCGLSGSLASQSSDAKLSSPTSYTPSYLADHILVSQTAIEGERKHVTVMFCDLANSTALAERVGPDAMHELLTKFFDVALGQVHKYEGTINQFLGDGFMALFGAPVTLEDHARRAGLAALAVHKEVTTFSSKVPALHQCGLPLRIGLNTGLVVVGGIGDKLRMDYTAVGDTTNFASRLQQLAKPGSIYVSEQTYALVREYFRFERLGAKSIKGKMEREIVFELVGTCSHPGQALESGLRGAHQPLVGREKEFTVLQKCLERLLATRQGQIISIMGDAGLGKSRLMAEARHYTADHEVSWLEGRGVSFSQTMSYQPFLEIIKSYAGITEIDSDVEAWQKLARHMTAMFPDQRDDILPYIGTLVGLQVPGELEKRVKFLDAEAMGNQIFLTTRRLFQRLAQRCPLVLVFEDAHWIDQSSSNLIEHLFPLTEELPILIVLVTRPTLGTPEVRLRTLAFQKFSAHYTEIVLGALSSTDSARLVGNLLAADTLSPKLHELILNKAEGNPFFLREVTQYVIAMGALVRDPSTGEWMSTLPPEQIIIPDTIHGVIMSRIDRLHDDAKEVLKIATVIGRSFLYRILRHVYEAEDELDRTLEALQQADLIREKRRLPELEYIFSHQLVQEATYESILLERRRQLHGRVGRCIESLFGNRLDDFYGLLAYHFARAEDWKNAREYLFKAGDQAGKVAADAEALAHYQEALKAYTGESTNRLEPYQQAALERKMGEALFRRGEHQQAVEYLHRALICLRSAYPKTRRGVRITIAAHVFVQLAHRMLPEFFFTCRRQSKAIAAERSWIMEMLGWMDYFGDQERFVLDALVALNQDERDGYHSGIARESTALGLICDLLPLYGLGSFYHQRAVTLAEKIQHPIAIGLAYLGRALHKHHRTGQWNDALNDYRRSIAAYKEGGHLRGWGGALWWLAWLLYAKGEFTRAMHHYQDIIQVGKDVADHQLWGWGLRGAGRILAELGEWDEAIRHLEQAIEVLKTIPDHSSVARTLSNLGQCYLHQGQVEKGLRKVEESQELMVKHGLRGFLSTEIHDALPEAYLLAVEQASDAKRASALKAAKRACREALRQSRVDREASAGAYRMQGTYEWLNEKPAEAQKWWRQSLDLAESLGARYDLGKTYLEFGQRLELVMYLDQAERIFTEIGAKWQVGRARQTKSAITQNNGKAMPQ